MDRWAVIRRVAAETLTRFEHHARGCPAFTGQQGSHAVLEDLADTCFGLTIIDDPDLPPNVRGKLDLDSDTIRLHPDLAGPRRTFTIAHDLGHRALDHPPRSLQETDVELNEEPHVASLAVQDGVFRAYDARDRWELEANVFAAELLAPVERVRAAVQTDQNWTVDGLAAYFGLSPTAMRNQLAAALLPGPPPSSQPNPAPENLDDSQHQAVTVPSPALVIAGPGAGKTRVLVHRFAHLIKEGNDPRTILALTFGNKAAAEMHERLALALPEHAHAITVTTFHGFGLELLREYGTHIGLQTPIQLLTPVDAYVFLRGRLAGLPLDLLEDVRRPARNLKLILDLIARAKDDLVGPAEFAHAATEWKQQLGQLDQVSLEQLGDRDQQLREADECAEVAGIYASYQEWLREAGYVDYGDLIAEAVRLLQLPEVAADIRCRWGEILVDEFQDINYASGRLVQALDGGRGVVWAVADPKQSIYRFLGASPANLHQFKADYPGARIQHLRTNYRSVEEIVRCAQAVVFPSAAPPDATTDSDEDPMHVPELTAQRGCGAGGPAITILSAAEWKDELAALIGEVDELHANVPLPQISVLCRTRNQAQAVADAFRAQGIATNWDGSLEHRSEFKDLMGVLLLAANDLRGLVRLASVPEHALAQSDLRLLLAAGNRLGGSVEAALHSAGDGEIEGLSHDGQKQAAKLRGMVGTVRRLPTPWRVLSFYLFEHAAWVRQLIQDPQAPDALLKLATLGQVVNLTREFSQRSGLIDGATTSDFLMFIQASLEAGDVGTKGEPLAGADAVNVLTIHQSKGLEWPVVLVPQLAEGRFPPRDNRRKLRLPPSLRRDPGQADEAMEQACLFYVALTRARDRLVLSRADRYSNRKSAPLELLSCMVARMAGSGFIQELTAPPSQDAPVRKPQTPLEPGWNPGEVMESRLLKRYEDCPRAFYYETVLRLRDDDVGYPKFHQAIYATLDWMIDQTQSGVMPSEATASQQFAISWEELGPTDHPYAPVYRKRGEQIVLAFAARLSPGATMRIREEVQLGAEPRVVSVRIDEIEEGCMTILRRHCFGPPAKSHAEDHLPFLFAAAHIEANGDAPYEVRNYYPLHDEDIPVPITSRKIQNRRGKMEELRTQIDEGHFAPKPESMRCSSCRFNLICPTHETGQ